MKKVNLTGIKIVYAILSPSSIGKKRRASEWVQKIINSLWNFWYFSDNTNQYGTDAGTGRNQFDIFFTIEYPPGCNDHNCQQKLIEEVKFQIEIAFKNITLMVTFTNGATANISLSLRSLIQTSLSKFILSIKSKRTKSIE